MAMYKIFMLKYKEGDGYSLSHDLTDFAAKTQCHCFLIRKNYVSTEENSVKILRW